jgi:hypothetical protein
MTNNKKKRLSLYDFFGRTPSPESIPAKTTKNHHRSTSETTKNSLKNNTSHRLTFNIPDESIVSNIGSLSIPLPKQKRKSVITPITNSPNISNNSNQVRISSPISPVSKNSLPISNDKQLRTSATNNDSKDSSRPLSPSKLRDKIDTSKRLISDSTSSLSSSIYPNDQHYNTKLRNASNSTLPDFSRQTSSIYPPSTTTPEIYKAENHHINPSTTIKRTDLLRKRKPPPIPLSVETSDTNKHSENHNSNNSETDTNIKSVTDSVASTDSEYSPLNLLPTKLNLSGTESDNSKYKNSPLGPSLQLNPSKNVMFATNSIDYESPSIISKQIQSNDDNFNKNTHKHSRTLSSIEEITSALEHFQLEHEKSFTSQPTNDIETNDSNLSMVSSPTSDKQNTIDLNLSKELDASIDQDSSTQDENGIFVKVKDLPELKHGETLNEYIEQLKSTPGVDKPVGVANHEDGNSYLDITNLGKPKPKATADDSDLSSSSELFFDVPEISENMLKPAEQEILRQDDISSESLTIENCFASKENQSTPDVIGGDLERFGENKNENENENKIANNRTSNSYDDVNNSTESEPYFHEKDLIGPLDGSFDSFVEKGEISKDFESEKNSETQTVSTSDTNGMVEMDDGDWRRYSSATNFFNNVDRSKGKHINDDINGIISHGAIDNDNEAIVTPTEKTIINLNTNHHQREFDLDDELDNNVVIHNESEESSDKSLKDLYPIDSDGEYADDSEINSLIRSEDINLTPNFERDFGYQSDHPKKLTVQNKDSDASRSSGTDSDVLEFSPRSAVSYASRDEITKTPELYRHNSMCSKGLLEKITGVDITGTPTGLGIGNREHFVVINKDANSMESQKFHDSIDDEGKFEEIERNAASIPDIESKISSIDVEFDDSTSFTKSDEAESKDHQPISTYDRREEPTVAPIQHSMIVTPAAPITGTLYKSKNKRPPPNYPSTGRRVRGLSETTAHPELFMDGIAYKLKQSIDAKPLDAIEDKGTGTMDSQNNSGSINTLTGNNDLEDDSLENRKGEKCTYIEKLRSKTKRTVINSNPSLQVLPIAIKQNGTISHKKIPSQQLSHGFRSHKHANVKSKTRMLASEIDDGELPDATLFHTAQKTKIPIHPDADVIAASEQFNQLTKQRSDDLGRLNSVLSVRPHYGNGMKLFITNPDSGD